MKRIDAGTSGISEQALTTQWAELKLGRPWQEVIAILEPGSRPRHAQILALGKHRVLEDRRNLIISSPTNSGKSLIGMLVLLEAIQRGCRAILLEPLRAIAREKFDELEAISPKVGEIFGRKFSVRISTGDYRIENEAYSAPPPDHGELIIATPERFDAILRNPDHNNWLSSIGAVCVDEAHLISSSRRGPTLEYLLTSLLCLPAPPRLVLLSATLGETTRACEWLMPCDVIASTVRHPVLQKEVLELDEEEDASEVVTCLVKDILSDARNCVLVFVYQTRSAEKLAAVINQAIDPLTGDDGALAYHGQMSADRRHKVRTAFASGRSRCVIATTALGLGVNLPATHVIVRDSTFPGVGKLGIGELLQMMGRAGRGDRSGQSIAIVRKQDGWDANELALALRKEEVASLHSHYDRREIQSRNNGIHSNAEAISIATHISSLLARNPDRGLSLAELRDFFERSLGGKNLVDQIQNSLAWLADPSKVLAFCDAQGKYKLTTLGLATVRGILPLQMGAGIAQLIRDLTSIDASDQLLAQWRPLDHLLVLNLLAENHSQLRYFSAQLIEQIDAWIEKNPQFTPLLYRQWIIGQTGKSRAIEVMGSLGISRETKSVAAEENARRESYLAVFRSIILYEMGNGHSINEIERTWNVKGLDGIQERWRDEFLWLLSGLDKIFDVRCFYFHLKEECQADKERVQRVKRLLRTMQIQTFELREHIKYCSPLGPLFRSLRRTQVNRGNAQVGAQTIKRLEDAGIKTIAELASLKAEDIVKLGVRRNTANKIVSYVRLRMH